MNIFQWSTVNFESGEHLLLLRHCDYKTLLTVGLFITFILTVNLFIQLHNLFVAFEPGYR